MYTSKKYVNSYILKHCSLEARKYIKCISHFQVTSKSFKITLNVMILPFKTRLHWPKKPSNVKTS